MLFVFTQSRGSTPSPRAWVRLRCCTQRTWRNRWRLRWMVCERFARRGTRNTWRRFAPSD